MTEEEVKAQIVLPWLQSRGVNPAELSLETTFTVRLGRRDVSVESRDKASGRLDILVRSGNRNLLIIETKRADEPLTEADRDQAVSYARLVHPIAPFALVTNGTESHLFDTVTRNRIRPEDVNLRAPYEITLPEADRLEALRHFREEILDRRRQAGTLGERWSGSTVSYSLNLSPAETAEIQNNVKSALRSSAEIPLRVRLPHIERIRERLTRASQVLSGPETQIAAPTLSLVEPLQARRELSASDEDFKRLAKQVMEAALDHYRTVVERNFPSFRRELDLYQSLPVRVLVVLPDVALDHNTAVAMYWQDQIGGDKNVVEVFEEREVEADLSDWPVTVKTPTDTVVCSSWEVQGAQNLLFGPSPVKALPYDYRGGVIRRWVYKWISDDFRTIEKELKNKYGITD